jgi:hypothetical protein
VVISISEKESVSSVVIFGGIAVLYGIGIYYMLPYALLTFNLTLILDIFFFILIGMLVGVTLLAQSVQGLIEKLFIYIFLFWETQGMKTLIKKNLVTHKARNSLTAVIYSLTLGSLIFLVVMLNLQAEVLLVSVGYDSGVDLAILGNS